MSELWKDIKGSEGIYQVSSFGRIRSLDRIRIDQRTGKRAHIKGKIIKTVPGTTGYLIFSLHRNYRQTSARVHRIVAETFIEKSLYKYAVNHINGIKTDNRVENLEWVTKSENELHAHRILGKKGAWYGHFGKLHHGSKPVNQYSLSGDFIKTWDSQGDIERKLGLSQGNISCCCCGIYKTAYGFIWKFKDKINVA